VLTSGDLLINKGLTVQGPGAGALTVQRSTAMGTPNFRQRGGARRTVAGRRVGARQSEGKLRRKKIDGMREFADQTRINSRKRKRDKTTRSYVRHKLGRGFQKQNERSGATSYRSSKGGS
jgi:hypothetical protein